MQEVVDLFEEKRSRHLLLLGAGIGLPATEVGARALLPEMGAEGIAFYCNKGDYLAGINGGGEDKLGAGSIAGESSHSSSVKLKSS